MTAEPRRTSLYSAHVEAGARTGEFAGWEMPLTYEGALAEHRAVRSAAGVFDVSHMGQIEVTGDGARDFLQRMLTNNVDALSAGDGQYTLMLTDSGGVIDDLIAYALPGRFLLVVNASNAQACVAWLAGHADNDVVVTDRSSSTAMMALQGPTWEAALAPLEPDGVAAGLGYFQVAEAAVAGVPTLIARTGYTGEPGVELMCPWDAAPEIWSALMGHEAAPAPAGLVARDTLRLEMGYPLHGNELGTDRTPLEAGLGWACDLDTEFTGGDVLRARREEGLGEKLCMFRMTERSIPRAGHEVVADGSVVGAVTSGTHSPTLGIGIGMAYVTPEVAAPGTPVTINVRGTLKAAETARRPLVNTSPTKG